MTIGQQSKIFLWMHQSKNLQVSLLSAEKKHRQKLQSVCNSYR